MKFKSGIIINNKEYSHDLKNVVKGNDNIFIVKYKNKFNNSKKNTDFGQKDLKEYIRSIKNYIENEIKDNEFIHGKSFYTQIINLRNYGFGYLTDEAFKTLSKYRKYKLDP